MEFDRLAPRYDADFSSRPVAHLLRRRTHERIAAQLEPGMRALDIGCGTGIDAAWMAAQGAMVTAVDGSAEMLAVAQRRAAGVTAISFAQIDLNALDRHRARGPFDLALANFGALNAVSNLDALAEWLADRVRPGGWVGMAVMSRFCAWETLWQAAHLRPRAAARRWRGYARFADMTVYYPTARTVTRAMSMAFRPVWRAGLGVFLPPSEMFGVVETRPRLFERLRRWDDAVWQSGRLAWAADHLWLEFRRT